MSAPRLSVVMPVYNALAFLSRTFEMLAAQTDLDFELIAVDDGSTDGSGAWLDAQRPPFALRVIHQPNAGAAAARNAALDAASGKYVMMVDSDDLVHPNAVAWISRTLDRSGGDFVVFDYAIVKAEEIDSVQARWAADTAAFEPEPLPCPAFDWFVRSGREPGMWQFAFRREAIARRRFKMDSIPYEDNTFVYPFLSTDARGVRLEKTLYGYVMWPSSITHVVNVPLRFRSLASVLRLLKDELPAANFHWLVRHYYFRTIKGLYRRTAPGGPSAAERPLRNAFLRQMGTEGLLVRGDLPWLWWLRFRLAGRNP